jgi:hypothetical protein
MTGPSGYDHYADPCMKGCGNKTSHASGVCAHCRKIKCITCGRPCVPSVIGRRECNVCARIREQQQRGVSASAAHIG